MRCAWLLALVVTACGPEISQQRTSYDSRFGEATELDVYRSPGVMKPGVMLVHGGGWREGSKSQLAGLATRLAIEGYVTASVNYRLGAEGAYPGAVNDVRCALSFLQNHSETFGLDATRITVLGYSAGGHLVSMVATGALTDCAEGIGAPPRAVIAAAAPQNLNALSWAADVQKFMSQRPDAYDEASPVKRVQAGAPPFLLIHGEADAYVPAAQATDMRDALLSHGNDARLLLLRGGGHVLNPAVSADQLSFESYVTDSGEAWLAMLDFLNAVNR